MKMTTYKTADGKLITGCQCVKNLKEINNAVVVKEFVSEVRLNCGELDLNESVKE